jgi:hypothetical protein
MPKQTKKEGLLRRSNTPKHLGFLVFMAIVKPAVGCTSIVDTPGREEHVAPQRRQSRGARGQQLA